MKTNVKMHESEMNTDDLEKNDLMNGLHKLLDYLCFPS